MGYQAIGLPFDPRQTGRGCSMLSYPAGSPHVPYISTTAATTLVYTMTNDLHGIRLMQTAHHGSGFAHDYICRL